MIKFGVQPVFHRDLTTNPAWIKPFVKMIEDAGANSIWAVEHPVIAENYEPLYSYSADGKAPFFPEVMMPDPLEWLSFVAACTDKITLATGILILPLHSPIIIAKRVATLDAISGGRLHLGVGLGWQKEEFSAVNVPYNERAARTDETIVAMRQLWTGKSTTFNGKHFQFTNLILDTLPAQKSVPILIGGSTEAAAKRAGKYGDGFYPYVISPEDFALRVEQIKAAAKEAGRNPADIELTIWPSSYKQGGALDLGLAKAYRDAGATQFLITAQESGSIETNEIERFVKRYRDEIIAKL
jgi:probable F420-dependent oxidoreductase